MPSRGITDEVLWQHNPKLVIAHLSGFGQYGTEEYYQSSGL
ncbi:CoA transferase [Escherichia coli]